MSKKNTNTIYLDNNASTKIDPRVLKAMMPFLTDSYANASSTHASGLEAHEAVKKSREHIASLIACELNELVFTSGATEAINLAIKGVAQSYKEKGKHIVTVQTEHPAVLDTCRFLEQIGYEVTYLPVREDGLLDTKILADAIRQDTILVSVMYVNNETGIIQPLKEISDIVHSKGSLFMTDGTQAVGKLALDVNKLGIDIMSFSAHKFYGPKGIGGLYIRSKRPNKVNLNPLLHGGGHEKGLRSGTLNVPGIVGIGKAAELALKEIHKDEKRINKLRNELENALLKLPKTRLNGNRKSRIYNTTNVCFEGIDADAIIVGLKNIAVSKGSACSTISVEPSHVLKAMGCTDDEAFSSIRFSLGRFTTEKEVRQTLEVFPKVLSHLKEIAK